MHKTIQHENRHDDKQLLLFPHVKGIKGGRMSTNTNDDHDSWRQVNKDCQERERGRTEVKKADGLAGCRKGKVPLCYSLELFCISFSANLTFPCSTLTLSSSLFTSRNFGTFSLQDQHRKFVLNQTTTTAE